MSRIQIHSYQYWQRLRAENRWSKLNEISFHNAY
jgi:hypothetical protein